MGLLSLLLLLLLLLLVLVFLAAAPLQLIIRKAVHLVRWAYHQLEGQHPRSATAAAAAAAAAAPGGLAHGPAVAARLGRSGLSAPRLLEAD